jgi:hypothetical protein
MSDYFEAEPFFTDEEMLVEGYHDWDDELNEEASGLDDEYSSDAPEEAEGPGFEYDSDENEWNLFVDSWQSEDPYFADNNVGPMDEYILDEAGLMENW